MGAHWLVFCLGLLSSFNLLSYRFICNGFLASGELRPQDSCGECSLEFAARWENPNIPVVVDNTPLPENISAENWREAVDLSFAAWENINGSSLRFVELDRESRREFGANESLHEIYWITDVEEWREWVGVGEFGTLGATLPRYTCGGDLGSRRVLFDADLVLNGMSHINWQMDCDNDDCISVQTTLVHELGHFFGLDHPCEECSFSIMSAKAAYDHAYPLFDDMEGIRALYPEDPNGRFASACTNKSDCSDNFDCFNDGDNKYCSNLCEQDLDCDQGAMCQKDKSPAYCIFIDSGLGRGLYESCGRVACQEPLVCAGPLPNNYFCFMPCEDRGDCDFQEECIDLPSGESLCVKLRSLRQSCSVTELCGEDLVCVLENARSKGTCLQNCLNNQDCPKDQACILVDSGHKVCQSEDDGIRLDGSSDSFDDRDPRDFGRGPIPEADPDASNSFSCAMNKTGNFGNFSWLLLYIIILNFCRKKVLKTYLKN